MAEQLTDRGYKYRNVPDNDDDMFGDYLNDDSGFNVAKMNDDLNYLDDKTTVDGQRQSNLDFIENGIVKDGLVFEMDNVPIKTNTKLSLGVNSTYTMLFKLLRNTGELAYLCGNESSSTGYTITLRDDNKVSINAKGNSKTSTLTMPDKTMMLKLLIDKSKASLYIDGILYVETQMSEHNNTKIALNGSNVNYQTPKPPIIHNAYIYNRILTSEEVQQNFIAINNQPSLSHLNVTDSTGKKSILFGTDSYHVIGRNGKTAEERYVGLLKRDAEEFVSTNGEDITIENGIDDSQILSGEIKGNTVKNEFYNYPDHSTINKETGITTFKNLDTGLEGAFAGSIFKNATNLWKPNTVYTCVIEVYETNYTQTFLCGMVSRNSGRIDCTTTGIKVAIFTTPNDLNSNDAIGVKTLASDRVDGRKISFRFGIYEGDFSLNNKVKTPQLGLSSTKAIINNNGQSYPVYEPTIQGKTSVSSEGVETGLVPTDTTLPQLKDGDVLDLATRVITFANKTTRHLTIEEVKAYWQYREIIELNKVGDVTDTFELKADGSALWENRLNRGVLTSSKNISLFTDPSVQQEGRKCFKIGNAFLDMKSDSGSHEITVISNNFIGALNTSSDFKTKGQFIIRQARNLHISLPDTVDTVDKCKEWLDNNYTEVVYVKYDTDTAYISKEAMTTIPIEQTNVLSCGDAVKASEFKVTVPINKVKTLEARLAALEAKTNTKVVNVPYVEETLAHSKNKIEEVMKNV